jgi:peroxiredoxin
MIPIEETMPADTRKRGALPGFRLPASNGGTIQLDDYRHHHPLVLIFLTDLEGEASIRWLQAFVADYPSYEYWDAKALAVIEGTQAEAASLAAGLDLPFPVLADEDGSTWERYLGGRGQAAILVLDRYNALQRSQIAERVADLMGAAAASPGCTWNGAGWKCVNLSRACLTSLPLPT